MNKRDVQILELVTENQRIEVKRLAERLNVSQVTIRKDLDALEVKGLIRREHGFAILGSSDDIGNRLAFHYEDKLRIARRAAALVSPGETVMIESGSCCALLAEVLAESNINVTIITNSAFIAGYVRKAPGVRIILLGGDYQNESQCMVGSIAKLCAQNFHVEKLFIGVDGYQDSVGGFMSNDHARAETVRDMAAQAKKVVVITESEKFARRGVVSLLPRDRVSMVITDKNLPAGSRSRLLEAKVEVVAD